MLHGVKNSTNALRLQKFCPGLVDVSYVPRRMSKLSAVSNQVQLLSPEA